MLLAIVERSTVESRTRAVRLRVQNVSMSVSTCMSASVPYTSGCYEWTIILNIVTVNFSEILCRPGKLLAFGKWQSWGLSARLTFQAYAAGVGLMTIKENRV